MLKYLLVCFYVFVPSKLNVKDVKFTKMIYTKSLTFDKGCSALEDEFYIFFIVITYSVIYRCTVESYIPVLASPLTLNLPAKNLYQST